MTFPISPGQSSLPLPLPRDTRDMQQVSPSRVLPQVDKSKVDPNTLKAAQEMEAMFINYMMKVMRDTVPKNDMDLENTATGIYRGMMDAETAQKAARAGGVGLADQIVAYLESQRYNLSRGPGVARDPTVVNDRHTGGTHEGQPDRK